MKAADDPNRHDPTATQKVRKKDDKPAALDHVLYEMQMLLNAVVLVSRLNTLPIHRSGWLEVFAVHARNLYEFFLESDEGGGYMKPSHFTKWTYTLAVNKEFVIRANSQVSHLTYNRERPEEKTQWPIQQIFETLRSQSLAFLKAVRADADLMGYCDNRVRTDRLLKDLPQVGFEQKKSGDDAKVGSRKFQFDTDLPKANVVTHYVRLNTDEMGHGVI